MLNLKINLAFLITILFLTMHSSAVFADCTVQGLKKYYSDDKELNGSAAPTAIINGIISSSTGATSTTAQLYSFNMVPGTAVISAPIVSGYDVGYTLCYNVTTCHGGPYTKGNSVTVSCNSGFIDLWWHYNKVGDLDLNKTVDIQDVIKLILLILS